MAVIILSIVILIFSIILHEYGHAWMANKLGDSTAKDLGRLTLNPIPHIDLFGSIILPLFFVLSGSNFLLAWAKPVPYNPFNIRDKKYGDLKVAVSGPGTNIIVAIFFGLLARFLPIASNIKANLLSAYLQGDFSFISAIISGNILNVIFLMAIIFCFLNLLLAIFNLIPVPPLDGSKIILNFLPPRLKFKFLSIERYGLFLILFLLMFGFFKLLFYPILFSLSLLTGIY
ncbi:MAG: site-2 protease family protein [Patescibacteria group bacterium]|nr:site-2 protease family protein [Patescibacteria group bacterium]